ncbi:hypothetical protein ABVT39_016841 [Epinephelus coioides]
MPEPTVAVTTPEFTKAVTTPKPTEAVTTPESTDAVMTPEVTEVIEVLTEDTDVTPKEIGEIVPSLPSASSSPALQVVEIPQPQSQLLAKRMTDFDDDVRSSPSLRTLGGQSKGTRKKLQWRRCFSGWRGQKIHPVPLEHFEEAVSSAETPEPTRAVMTPEAVTTPEVTEVVELLTEDIDVTPEIGELVPSPPSASSLPSALQVVEIPQPQSQLLAKIVTDFDEDVRRSPSLRTSGGQSGGTRKKLQWRRYLHGWQRQKIHPAPLEHFEETVRSANTPCSKETFSTTSCSSSLKDHRFIPLKLEDYNEDEDHALEGTLMCLSLPDHQVAEVTPLAEAMTDEVTQKISTCQGSVDRSQLTEYVSNNQTDDHETKAKRSNISRFFSNIFSKIRMHSHGDSAH